MATVYKRGKVWWVRFQWRGEEIRRSSRSSSKAKASRFLAELQEEYERLDKGGLPRRTFNEAMARFIQEHLPTLRPGAAYRYIVSVRALKQHFDRLYLDEITRATIAEYVVKRKKDVSDTTIRRDLACASSMMSCAINWDWAKENPFKDFNKRSLRECAPRTRFLSRDEYKTLLKHAGTLRPIIVVAVETGLRLGEILALEWNDIDQHRREIRVRDSKTSTPRRVPMSEEASAQISAQPRHIQTTLVFHRPSGDPHTVPDISKRFGKVVKAAKLKDLRFHDLRHTFASWKVQQGHDLYKIGKILGHKAPQMTMRYAHLRTEDLHDVMKEPGTKAGTEERDLKA